MRECYYAPLNALLALLLFVANHVVYELCSCGSVRVSMWVKNVLHIRVVRRGGEGRPVAARRISRSCVVAAGLLARGDTRTEERDVRGGGGIWVVMERLWNWGVKSSTRDEERWRAL